MRPLKVLLSEGSSTSAREAVTVLGLAGHHVEICDPDPHCISRFSRFVRRYHRCPPLGADPAGYLAFVERLVAERGFDVLVPIHEQGLAFAAVQDRFRDRAGLALPRFTDYETALSKAAFSHLLDELGIAQPATEIVASARELAAAARFPAVVKRAIGTASRSVWMVPDRAALDRLLPELEREQAFAEPMLLQAFVDAPIEHAQAVFCEGRLLAMHAYAQVARGAGGGDAIKESVARPQVRADLARIGERLAWHGALSVDYLLGAGRPLYIDCNPRLVEPMSAYLAGLDLADLVLRISLGARPGPPPPSRPGVRSHIGLQALLGAAIRGASRRALLAECWRLFRRAGPYAGSREELTPAGLDWPSAIPISFAALFVLARPSAAQALATKGWGAHLLNPRAVALLREIAR